MLEEPEYFRDLGLDLVVRSMTAGREEYELVPFFYSPLRDREAIAYRQEVMRDLESPLTRRVIEAFAVGMRARREHLAAASKSHYQRERQRWVLAAAEVYLEAVERLARDLADLEVSSRGMCAFRGALACYLRSAAHQAFATETRELVTALASLTYSLLIRDGTVVVRPYGGEADYSSVIEETFRKFQQGLAQDHRFKFDQQPGMNHVEAEILERVARLYPDVFGRLASFDERYPDHLPPLVARFDREIQFYLAYLDHIGGLREAGLCFCYPQLTERKDIRARETFDLALTHKLLREGRTVVSNDFYLEGNERALVVTGPNQSGKTTFARMFGQLHYLASLGGPVPGREARLFLPDRLFTHFEREEELATRRGRLEDDLVRLKRTLDRATPESILLINEILSSTTVDDAVFLGREILGRITELGALCVYVTFLDELATFNDQTVSMVGMVDPHDPTRRTFKIERRPADGLARFPSNG